MNLNKRVQNCCQIHWNGFFYFVSPLVLLPLVFLEPKLEWRCIFLLLWALIWYSIDAAPVAATAILPIITLPLLGVVGSNKICMSFAGDSNMLFLLCNFIAVAMEHCELVKHEAYFILHFISCDPHIILLALMVFSYVIAAIVPAAFVCALMMPITKALLQLLDDISVCKAVDDEWELKDDEPPYPSKVANAFYIGVAYAINIGSITMASASDSGFALRQLVKNEDALIQLEDSFHLKYLLFSLPVSFVLLIFTIFYLEVIFLGLKRSDSSDKAASEAALEIKANDLPRFNSHMFLVGILFLCSIIGVIVCSFLNPLVNDKVLKYSVNAMLLCFFYFVLPKNFDFCNYFCGWAPKEYKTIPSILPWGPVNKLTPWKTFLVHGSSSAFGIVMKNTNLHLFLGNGLLEMYNRIDQQLGFIGLTVILTIMSSNDIVADIMLNMGFKAVSDSNASQLLYPITWACCMTFLLPVSSSANSFALGWGNIRAKDMMLAGIGPTVFGYLLAVIMCLLLNMNLHI